MRRALVGFVASIFSVVAFAAPADAQINAGNLVNVNVSNIDVTITDVADVNAAAAVPIGVVAAICDTTVAVLAADLEDDGTATCEARNEQTARAFARQFAG